jgi:hypothetical protein
MTDIGTGHLEFFRGVLVVLPADAVVFFDGNCFSKIICVWIDAESI